MLPGERAWTDVECDCRAYPESLVDVFHYPSGTAYRGACMQGAWGDVDPAPETVYLARRRAECPDDDGLCVYVTHDGSDVRSIILRASECVVLLRDNSSDPRLYEVQVRQAPA